MVREDDSPPAPLHVVVGCNGPVGVDLMERLRDEGLRVKGVCRSGRSEAPAGAEIVAADIASTDEARAVCDGASVVYCCVGIDYRRWQELWPPVVEGVLAGAEAAGASLVFADNLYSYGPHRGRLREDLPLTDYGRKPALRSRMTRRLLAAHEEGRVAVTLVRASDFYGPRVTNSGLGELVFGRLLEGKSAQVLGRPDVPHSYTYVGDFARALVTVAGVGHSAGSIWHVPSAPARTTREVLEVAFRLAGREPKVSALPWWVVRLAGLGSPLMRELAEMKFVWTEPYVVDHSRFAARFWDDYTPLETGLARTLEWYRRRDGGGQ